MCELGVINYADYHRHNWCDLISAINHNCHNLTTTNVVTATTIVELSKSFQKNIDLVNIDVWLLMNVSSSILNLSAIFLDIVVICPAKFLQ